MRSRYPILVLDTKNNIVGLMSREELYDPPLKELGVTRA
jgi:hypothetical protein